MRHTKSRQYKIEQPTRPTTNHVFLAGWLAGWLTCVVREMHRIDGVDVETEELQGEYRALVAYVPAHDVGLNAASNNHARRQETDMRGNKL